MTYPPQYPNQQNYPAYAQQAQPQYAPQAPQYPAPQQAAPVIPFQPVPTFVSAPGTSDFPRMADLRGRLLLIKPQKTETVNSTLTPGTTFESVQCDVIVLDGGPVVSTDPKTGGKVFDGHEFKNIGLAGARVTGQLRSLVGGTDMVLGRINTQQGTLPPAKGNAWGVETNFTAQDAEVATRYLNGDRSMVVMPGQIPQFAPNADQQLGAQIQGAAAQQFQQAVAQHPAQQYNQAPQGPPAGWGQQAAPQQAPVQALQGNPWDQGGQPLQPGANPFAPQG